jgi:hypothetical protein
MWVSSEQSSAQQIARRLIDSRRTEPGEAHSEARAAAAACDALYLGLSRWVGPDGSHALFSRALAEARTEHPALMQIELRVRSEPYVDGVTETIMAHGEAATRAGLESMLVRLIALLGRLIGDEMAMRLIEQSLAASERGAAPPQRQQEEA